MAFTVPEITIPGLNEAPCGLNPKIEELNAVKDKAQAKINSLTSSSGGITDSIAALSSSVSSAVSEVAAKLNENLFADIPTIGLKLQDEFHSAINSFGTGQPGAGLTKLKEIEKQFPSFDMQKALDAAAGILPAGAIPANAAELIKTDLSKMNSDLEIALPKFQQLGGDISSGVTSLLGNAQTAVGSALSSISSGSGTTEGLTGLASEAQTAVSDAAGELSKLGGAFSAKDGPISKLMTSLSDTASSLSANLTEGIAKIPAFDICTQVPNLQVVNGVVEELAIAPTKPTVDSEPPTLPAPAPAPATPDLVGKFTFPFWTKAKSEEFRDIVAYPVNDGTGDYNIKVQRIPLDTSGSWAAEHLKAKNLLFIASSNWRESERNSGLAARVAADPGDGSVLTSAEKELLARYIATWKDLSDKTNRLEGYNRRYNYRVRNNLIDRLE